MSISGDVTRERLFQTLGDSSESWEEALRCRSATCASADSMQCGSRQIPKHAMAIRIVNSDTMVQNHSPSTVVITDEGDAVVCTSVATVSLAQIPPGDVGLNRVTAARELTRIASNRQATGKLDYVSPLRRSSRCRSSNRPAAFSGTMHK